MAKTIEELMAKAGGFEIADETEDKVEETKVEKTEETTKETKDESVEENQEETTEETSEETQEETTEAKTEDTKTEESASEEKVIPKSEKEETKEQTQESKTTEETSDTSNFASEQVEKLNNYIAQGGKFEDFARTQTTDYTKMDHVDLILEQTALEYPELDANEVKLLVDDTYGVGESATDKDRKLALIKLKRDGEAARKAMLEHQKKWSVPASAGKTPEQIEAENEKWISTLNSTVDKVENLEIALNDKDKFSFKVEDAAKGKIKENHKDVTKFFSRYMKEDGSADNDKFVKEMFILDNFETIVRAAAAYNKTKGKEDIIDEIKNPDFKGRDRKSSEDESPSIATQAAREIFGK